MRLLVVTNRLPVTVLDQPDGYKIERSIGGLSTGLESYFSKPNSLSLNNERLWIGWSGDKHDISPNQQRAIRQLLRKDQYHPVFLSNQAYANYYLGFSNQTLWPLFHSKTEYVQYKPQWWRSYQAVNQLFADQLQPLIRPNDVVWIHDYHLMLLPRLLRTEFLKLKIGYFLHIPFPHTTNFQNLPTNTIKQLINGLTAADIIGFHTAEYAENFSDLVSEMNLTNPNHKTSVYPMGIDTQHFFRIKQLPQVQRKISNIKEKYPKQKIIFSVDRLDYAKAIPERLRGYRTFLTRNPHYHQLVTLVLCVAPSREDIPHYQTELKLIESLVQEINYAFTKQSWLPIHYYHQTMNLEELVAHYTASDILLVTPEKDGMNLVAKEFVATKGSEPGVLILSTQAGAASELTQALLTKPQHLDISIAIERALKMPVDEQQNRNQIMYRYLTSHTVHRWANEFITDLQQIRSISSRSAQKILYAPIT